MKINDSLPEGVTRDIMEVDALIVCGGAAGLACAYRLATEIERHNQLVSAGKIQAEPIPEQMIVVIGKGSEIGAHSFSGAVLNLRALAELIPNYKELNCPLDTEVKKDAVYYL